MTLEQLKEHIDDMYNVLGGDINVVSYLNHNHAPSIFYDEDDDCIYVNT